MALDYGPGVSRTLSPQNRQFGGLIWQKSKPPLDSELSLVGQIGAENTRQTLNALMPSGFFLDPTRTVEDFQTNPQWSNLFKVGNPRLPYCYEEVNEKSPIMWACVNGWVVPVCGTDTYEGDISNVIKLYPPPESDTRIDYLFLEVWQARVDPNPSTVNKPSAATLYKHGNVKYGGVNITDDLEDPTLKVKTSARVQLQYRLRVYGQGTGLGGSVALDVYPDGLGDPHILGQATAALPVGGYRFENMREELADPGLWRAGDGNPNNALGTLDGYVYAIPVAAVFRRASNVYVAVNSAGNPNHNGAFCRTPNTKLLPDPLTGARELLTATLTSDLGPTVAADPLGADATINITNLNGCGLEDTFVWSNIFLVLDGEIIGISARNIAMGTITIPAGGRGRYGTAAVGHTAGTALKFYNTRPDGLFSDQITDLDILDLRHAVNASDWDFGRLLEHNVAALLKGDLHSTWKHAAAGNTQGVSTHEVTYLWGDGSVAVPNHTEAADGPDGIRMVWSDAATIQPDVTVLLDNEAPQDGHNVGLTNENTFTSGAGYAWDVGAGFFPSGFMNVGTDPDTTRFCNGTTILLFTGGRDGSGGARATFRDGTTRAVRALTPREFWKAGATDSNQSPISLRFLTERANEPAPPSISSAAKAARHVGPFYPWRDTNFERPFIVLGGLLRSELQRPAIPVTEMVTSGGTNQINVGIDFDALGAFYSLDTDGEFENDPSKVLNPLLRDQRTLFGMLTNNGTDITGASSEVYIVIYGDKDNRDNNGAFKVVGAGTVGYTRLSTTGPNAATSIIVEPLCPEFVAFDDTTGNTVTIEFRSQETNSEDLSNFDNRVADLAIVLTDIGGLTEHPWERAALGFGAVDGYDISMPFPGTYAAVESKLLISMSLLYHPGRAGTVRVPDEIVRYAMKGGTTDTNGAYLRQSPATIDTTFSIVGAPTNETFWDPTHVQLWNRLPALGLHAPADTNYGGNVVGYTEQDREHELFFDRGSKTLIFRPMRDRRMTLDEVTWVDPDVPTNRCLLGEYTYVQGGHQKDALRIWTGNDPDQGGNGKKMGFVVPREFMPRFGRQDIPYYRDIDVGTGPFLSGINHLFVDGANINLPVFNIIGGFPTSSSTPAVYPMFFVTGGLGGYTQVYGEGDTMPAWMQDLPFIWARRAPTDINTMLPYAQEIVDELKAVNSSDFGKGLKGIQLPPYYGIARLYGVYDVRDFDLKGGRSFKANRVEMEADPAPNLLREDATQQTLFILQGGGKDFGGDAGDHTYLVPYNALDVTRSLSYDPLTDTPETMHYVVECSTFGFARGFIDKNNLVLVRKFAGTGLSLDGDTNGNEDGDNLETEGIHMVLPCAAAYHDQFYAAYNRTVYQGDPYMSRGGAKTESDYETRYGQLSVGAQWAMRAPIEQYDAVGNFVPQTPNPKPFEILASMDFYTTMGTGKIGGQLYAGTPLDVCYTEATARSAHRLMDEHSVPWRVLPRAYTEGQKNNPSRATLDLAIWNNNSLNPTGTECLVVRVGKPDGTFQDLWAVKEANKAALFGTGVSYSDMFTVDISRLSRELTAVYTISPDPLLLGPGESVTKTVTVTGANVGDSVIINYPTATLSPLVDIRGRVSATDTVTLQLVNTFTALPFAETLPNENIQVVTAAGGPYVIAPGAMTTLGAAYAVPGALGGMTVLVQGTTGLFFTGLAGANTVTITATNMTSAPITVNNGDSMNVVLLPDYDQGAHTFDVGGYAVQMRVIQIFESGGQARRTAMELSNLIFQHPALQGIVGAFNTGDHRVTLFAYHAGAEGNQISASIRHTGGNSTYGIMSPLVIARGSIPNTLPTKTYLQGGVDIPLNAGDGTSQINLTGMTERLPMGALLQDSDFLCENPLGDDASAIQTSPVGPRPIQSVMPLTAMGGEYTRFMGAPGELLALADGSISVTSFGAYRQVNEWGGGPTGSKRFRLYRGGGSAFTLSGANPGAPVDWVSETFPSTLQPVLKGGALACRAMLVRSYREDVTPSGSTYKVSDGDEIQMVLITNGILGDGASQQEGITFGGSISPTGYGEGWAAADRYRLNGKPMFRGFSRAVPNPADVELVVYPDGQQRT